MVWPSVFFMHMGVRMKNVSKLTDAQRASSGEGYSPTRLKKIVMGSDGFIIY